MMMNETPYVDRSLNARHGEGGGSRFNFLVVLALLAIVAYVGYQYVPVAIHAYQFKDFMQQTVDKGTYGQSPEWVRTQLKANAADYGVPDDATITTMQRDGRIEARVQFTHPIALPGYIYQYNFDETVRSTTLLSGTK